MKDIVRLILELLSKPENVLCFLLITLAIVCGCIYAGMTTIFIVIFLALLIFVVLPICISLLAELILKKIGKEDE